jgi:hypothetical protein
MGTHLLASLGSKGRNGNSLACLRNAGSHSAESYCTHASNRCPHIHLLSVCQNRATLTVRWTIQCHLSSGWGGLQQTRVCPPIVHIDSRSTRTAAAGVAAATERACVVSWRRSGMTDVCTYDCYRGTSYLFVTAEKIRSVRVDSYSFVTAENIRSGTLDQ